MVVYEDARDWKLNSNLRNQRTGLSSLFKKKKKGNESTCLSLKVQGTYYSDTLL